jgi:hypothetical protein
MLPGLGYLTGAGGHAVIDTGIDYRHGDLSASMWVSMAEANGVPGGRRRERLRR